MKTQRFDHKRLKKLREQKDWSQDEMLRRLYDAGLTLSRPTYAKYEDTGNDLDVKDLEVIAKVFEEPIENFFVPELK